MLALFPIFCPSFLDLETTPNSGSSSASAPQGGAFTFTYPEVKSFPNPRFTWRKSGRTMSETQRISFSKAGNLYIGNVDSQDLADSSGYTSTVENTVVVRSFNRGPVSLGVSSELLIVNVYMYIFYGIFPFVIISFNAKCSYNLTPKF